MQLLDKDEAVSLLKGGMDGIIEWNSRRSRGDRIPPLDGASLRCLNLAIDVPPVDDPPGKMRLIMRAGYRSADLSGVILQGADLTGAIIEGVNLSDANLRDANLNLASLRNSDLRHSCLATANLAGANISASDLRGTDLENAILYQAHLIDCWLTKCNFKGATFDETVIGSSLRGALGLESIFHGGPSEITLGSILDCMDDLPLSFLRGLGIPEEDIEYFRGRVGPCIQFYSCFISYSHRDKAFARRLHDQLQSRGIRCWLDEHAIKPGDRILESVNQAIRVHDKVVLCCSESSLESWWVKDEIRKAHERERSGGLDIIIPLTLDRYLLDVWNDGLASDLRSRFAVDFSGWEHNNAVFEKQFERVVLALKAGVRPLQNAISELRVDNSQSAEPWPQPDRNRASHGPAG